MAFALMLLAVLLVTLLLVLPIWSSEGWGYGPVLVIGIVVLVLLFMH